MGLLFLIDHAAQDPVADLASYLETFTKIYTGRIVVGYQCQVDKMPERDFGIYHDWLAANNKKSAYFPSRYAKKMCCYWLIPLLHHLNWQRSERMIELRYMAYVNERFGEPQPFDLDIERSDWQTRQQF